MFSIFDSISFYKMSNKGVSALFFILFLCFTLCNCSLNLPSLNKPKINYFSKDNIISTKAENSIKLDLKQIQFTNWEIIAEYPVIGGKIKKTELVGDNLIIDQLGINSISLKEKKINWIKPEFTMYEYGGGIVEDNLICLKGFTGDIYCFNLNSGECKWIYRKTDYLMKNPLSNARPRIRYINSEIVLLENCLGPSSIPIQAISTKTGRIIWEHEVEVWGNITELKTTSILYVNDKITIINGKKHLIGVNTTTGKEIWKIKIEDLSDNLSSIESSLFFELVNGNLFCLTGNKELEYYGCLIEPVKGRVIFKSINCLKNIHVVANSLYNEKSKYGEMYVLGIDDSNILSVVCVNLLNMQEEWRTVIGNSGENNINAIVKFYFFPEIKDNVFLQLSFYKNEDINGFYCFNKKDGSVEWMNTSSHTSSSIIYRNSMIFYCKNWIDSPYPKAIECFDLRSWKILWNIQLPDDFIYDIGFIDDNILINVHQNSFILIEPQTGKILKAFPTMETTSSFPYIKFLGKIGDHILFNTGSETITEITLNETFN